jgi:hypothetical protein
MRAVANSVVDSDPVGAQHGDVSPVREQLGRERRQIQLPVAGQRVELVGAAGLGEVPMYAPMGLCGLTVTDVELTGGLAVSFVAVWRASFGPALACVGDVVLELVPVPCPDGSGSLGPNCADVRVLVASPRGWLWLGEARRVGRRWPYLVAPLVWLVHQQYGVSRSRRFRLG